jgi:hypothetical protein
MAARKNAAKQRPLIAPVMKTPAGKPLADAGAMLGRRAANSFVSTNARAVPKAPKINTVPVMKPSKGGV